MQWYPDWADEHVNNNTVILTLQRWRLSSYVRKATICPAVTMYVLIPLVVSDERLLRHTLALRSLIPFILHRQFRLPELAH